MKANRAKTADYATKVSSGAEVLTVRAVAPRAIAASKPGAYAHPPCIIPAAWLEGFRRVYPLIEDQPR